MKKLSIALVAFSIVALGACNQTTPTPEPTPQPTATSSSEAASMVQMYDGPLLTGTHMVTMKTSMGDIMLELDADAAPMTVTNFVKLAEQGYYTDLTFHRVIPNFMVQGGDPLGNGTGGESVFGANFKDEINANSYGLDTKMLADTEDADNLPEELQDKSIKEFYELQGYVYDDTLDSLPMERGVIAMANRGHDTNGSQFFIIQAENGTPWLEGRHTVFGRVTEGMDVVDAIAAVERNAQDQPVSPVTFTVVTDAMMDDPSTSAQDDNMMDDDMMDDVE